ncbi:ATP-binding protein [Granulosicoccaceae sp. 1_MG-2023]|nr:ATP-binding protein [Granulosicoccaceae sp. 1_MG-2023]
MSDPSSYPAMPDLSALTGPGNGGMEDEAWISVIQKMEAIYSDLLRYQVELEEKNAALENAQRFIDSVMSSMSDVLIVCDVNGHIMQVNAALTCAIGTDSAELTGRPYTSLFTRHSAPRAADFLQQVRQEAVVDVEADLQHKDGHAVPMAINCSPRLNHNNRYSGMVLTGRPLGELRRAYDQLNTAHAELKTAQKQLIQSEKMASLGRLVAGVAHELNNPISIVYGNMYALRRYESRFRDFVDGISGITDPAEQARLRRELRLDAMLKDIGPLIDGSLEGAERVNQIVQNLLRFSIPQQQETSAFNLHKVASTALQWVLRSSALSPALTLDIDPSLTLKNHEGYVHQILVNLFQNAVDAMETSPAPALQVRAVKEQDSVTLTVQDNGPGIAENDLLRLYDPFFTRKAVGKGTGLGLYISYGLATEQCNGSLRAENAEQGGARFILQLPLEEEV